MQKETKGSDITEKKETIVDTENKPEQSKDMEAKGMQIETVIKGIESTEVMKQRVQKVKL